MADAVVQLVCLLTGVSDAGVREGIVAFLDRGDAVFEQILSACMAASAALSPAPAAEFLGVSMARPRI